MEEKPWEKNLQSTIPRQKFSWNPFKPHHPLSSSSSSSSAIGQENEIEIHNDSALKIEFEKMFCRFNYSDGKLILFASSMRKVVPRNDQHIFVKSAAY